PLSTASTSSPCLTPPLFFSSTLLLPPPISTLFPYTTLFRSLYASLQHLLLFPQKRSHNRHHQHQIIFRHLQIVQRYHLTLPTFLFRLEHLHERLPLLRLVCFQRFLLKTLEHLRVAYRGLFFSLLVRYKLKRLHIVPLPYVSIAKYH